MVLLHIFFSLTANVVLTVSSSSRASVSPVVLLKLLVLDEEREMFGLLLLHSFSLIKGLLRKTDGNREKLKMRCSTDDFDRHYFTPLTLEECWDELRELVLVLPLFVGADLRWTGIGWCLWLHFLGQRADLCRLLVTADKEHINDNNPMMTSWTPVTCFKKHRQCWCL